MRARRAKAKNAPRCLVPAFGGAGRAEPFRLECPSFADELVGREALQGLEPAPEVVGGDEVSQVRAQLVVRGVVEPLDRGFLDGAVHALDLSIRPRVSRL